MMRHFATGIVFSSVPISSLCCFGVAELQDLTLTANHIVEANDISPPGVGAIDHRKTTTNYLRGSPSTASPIRSNALPGISWQFEP